MKGSPRTHDTDFLAPLLGDLFVVEAIYRRDKRLEVSLGYRYDREKSNALIRERLRHSGYDHSFHETDEHLILSIDPRRHFRIPPVNLLLFLLTLFTVYIIPVFFRFQTAASSLSDAVARTLSALGNGAGIEFTLAMITILFVHEMGHYTASRRRGIVTSWPYFIPAPNIIGTFGAIIKSKSPFWNRRDLIEVGASGPIAGWVIAVAWLVYGLSNSDIMPMNALSPDMLPFTMEGESLLIRFLVPILTGSAPDGWYYVFTEAAFAGWVGLLVTAINLLPVGQLDGGHILYGLIRKKQTIFGWIAVVGLLALGFHSLIWWIFAAFGLFFGVSHPPTLNDGRRPGTIASVMAIVAIVILIVSLTPVPFR